jgi:hypothetical protein
VNFPVQKSFGAFIAERFGPKWVYAQRASDRIARQYPGSVVITPKQQRQLAADYKREWGEEYSPASWNALCALRCIRDHAVARDNCPATIQALAEGAILALTT